MSIIGACWQVRIGKYWEGRVEVVLSGGEDVIEACVDSESDEEIFGGDFIAECGEGSDWRDNIDGNFLARSTEVHALHDSLESIENLRLVYLSRPKTTYCMLNWTPICYKPSLQNYRSSIAPHSLSDSEPSSDSDAKLLESEHPIYTDSYFASATNIVSTIAITQAFEYVFEKYPKMFIAGVLHERHLICITCSFTISLPPLSVTYPFPEDSRHPSVTYPSPIARSYTSITAP